MYCLTRQLTSADNKKQQDLEWGGGYTSTEELRKFLLRRNLLRSKYNPLPPKKGGGRNVEKPKCRNDRMSKRQNVETY